MRPWSIAVAALGLAYAIALVVVTYAHPAFLIGVPLATLLGAWLARRGVERAGPRHVGALLVALYLLPFARLSFWNAESPIAAWLLAWGQWLSRAVAGGYHPHEALSWPAYALFLVVFLVPTALVVAALVVAPLGLGALTARVASPLAAPERRRLAAGVGALALVVAVVAFPVACDSRESFVEVENKRCSCVGLDAPYYPPGILDGSETVYCIGVERRA